ncbi:hypothetical protein [Hymenobacter terrenus]|uniref:hypothetical protein n=1 Tax=Hymenobacter terrenus TaxID=1629124 RepID=UPI0006192E1C|nr:hypothetical protein [Hymenobacter terrenus]
MKKTVTLLAVLCAVAHTSFAQEVKTDKIVKLNGETVSAKVTSVTDRDVSFVYPGEEAVNVISANQVKEIDFASGRVQTLATRVEIHSEEDWGKVVITTIESDVKGLVSKGDVVAAAIPMTAFSSQANMDARATEKLKRKAAKLGAHMILLTGDQASILAGKTVKKGVAYSY